jgi:DNA-binding NtrC family response regulator
VRGLKDEAEAKEIQRVLEHVNGNRKLAAVQLNISYKALVYKMKQYGLSPQADRKPRVRSSEDV